MSKEPVRRSVRLLAFVIDQTLWTVPFMTVSLRFKNTPMLILVGIYSLALLLVQFWFLARDGQTLGKKFLKMRIVGVNTGENRGFVWNVLVRSVCNALISAVPGLGLAYWFIDSLFIFSEQKRCLHDHMSATIVVDA